MDVRNSGWPNWAVRRGDPRETEGRQLTALTDNMTFGTFMAPFHRVGENPTLAWNEIWS